MAVVTKKLSQVALHMAIAFVIAYLLTGSVVVGGMAILIEPLINVLLLPFHQKIWSRHRQARTSAQERLAIFAAEKVSQVTLHAVVAFAVIYGTTGSAALGGLAALLEPVCNVILLPLLDRAWDAMPERQLTCA
ncbi:DUF2061 domain-containing protein [Massilia sp. H6]|uniref:DUF2061 domain-containing protein n=1 Tax=Massilia sp. H6 TaxID=2970464 RepID=UPI0021687A63|nr:DUF2061 domain-containing protein [Massilia sp. H6]UVW29338.1 DUF2061 domain-containing protein [Massilia sp. H6]